MLLEKRKKISPTKGFEHVKYIQDPSRANVGFVCCKLFLLRLKTGNGCVTLSVMLPCTHQDVAYLYHKHQSPEAYAAMRTISPLSSAQPCTHDVLVLCFLSAKVSYAGHAEVHLHHFPQRQSLRATSRGTTVALSTVASTEARKLCCKNGHILEFRSPTCEIDTV